MAGVIIGVVVQISTTMWLAAHRGRVAAHVLSAELAGHELALCRWLDVTHTRNIRRSDRGYTLTFGQLAEKLDRSVPVLPTSAWRELRGLVVETAPDDLLIPLVGWYEPLADRSLLSESEVGTAVVKGFGGATEAVEQLAERSRWQGFWFVLRGTPKTRSRV